MEVNQPSCSNCKYFELEIHQHEKNWNCYGGCSFHDPSVKRPLEEFIQDYCDIDNSQLNSFKDFLEDELQEIGSRCFEYHFVSGKSRVTYYPEEPIMNPQKVQEVKVIGVKSGQKTHEEKSLDVAKIKCLLTPEEYSGYIKALALMAIADSKYEEAMTYLQKIKEL